MSAISKKPTRRRFLQSSLAATLCFSQTQSRSRAIAASDRLRVGVVGTGVRGKFLIGNLPSSVTVTAICDCATQRIESTLSPSGTFKDVLAQFHDQDAQKCTVYRDYRKMFDRQTMDAVIIAAPDHHHTLAAMLALQAGLDVYLEKPLTVCVREGRLLADAVKRTGRVLQVGSQQRTMELNRFACDFIRNGGLGRVTKVELPNYPGPLPVGTFAEESPVAGVDFNLFCGPTTLRPHHRQLWMKEDFRVNDLLWRGWDLYRDYSGHLMTNWGAHSVDMVQLALGQDYSGPVEIRAMEPQSVREQWLFWKAKTPPPVGDPSDRRFWPVTMKYADGGELHFVHGSDFIVFHGEKGRMKMRRNYFETDPPDLISNLPDASVSEKWKGSGHVARPHLENWLDCIRSRSVPNAPVEAGHRTATICHLANIARELNRPLHWNPVEEQFTGDNEANPLLDRPRRQGFELLG